MNWQDEGYLISKIKFRENAVIIKVFTKNNGKVSGIVYGGNSRKVKNYLQISNKIYLTYNSKNENKIGYFKTELIDPISPLYFSNKRKTAALLSLASILNVILPESQPYDTLYSSLSSLLNNLKDENWILLYIYWELNLIKQLGFDTNLKNIPVGKDISEDNIISITIDNSKYKVPKFLLSEKNEIINDKKLISAALGFTRNIFLNKFFAPNNLIFPKARVILENYYN